MTFDLGDGKQVVIANGRIQIWANRGCLGVQLTLEQQEEIGLEMWTIARKARRALAPIEASGRDAKQGSIA